MENINVLKQQKNTLKEGATALVNRALASKKDLEGADLQQYNAMIASIENINERIDAHTGGATIASQGDALPGFLNPAVSSSGVSAKTSGLSAHLRAARAGSPEVREQAEAFEAYLKGDIRAAANLTPAGDGAVLIPSFVFPALERAYTDFSPVESVARVWGTDTGADVVYPVLSDTETAVQLNAAAATGADDTVSGDTPPTALTGPTMHAYKVSSKPVFVPRETATDSSIDILGEIILALYARIARFENSKYTKGVGGSTEAEGFLTNATKLVTGAVALDLDICLDLAYNVPALYRPGGLYMMTDTTAKYLRKLKTGLSGDKRQLWADADATKGTPATLHGYPVIINNDMDDVSGDGTFAAKNPVAFGNFSKFVVRKAEQGKTFLRRYEVPAKDGAAAILFRRSDSKLIVPAAISKIAVS
jgi:HK97 family phage major capsid protein